MDIPNFRVNNPRIFNPRIFNPRIISIYLSRDQKIPGWILSENPGTKANRKSRDFGIPSPNKPGYSSRLSQANRDLAGNSKSIYKFWNFELQILSCLDCKIYEPCLHMNLGLDPTLFHVWPYQNNKTSCLRKIKMNTIKAIYVHTY